MNKCKEYKAKIYTEASYLKMFYVILLCSIESNKLIGAYHFMNSANKVNDEHTYHYNVTDYGI